VALEGQKTLEKLDFAMTMKKAPVENIDHLMAEVRAQIDQIDAAMHELLLRRAEMIVQARDIKTKSKQKTFIRPGREAQILRAHAARPQGHLPAGMVSRVWREIISDSLLSENPTFKVGVFVPDKGEDLWDVARDHFGSHTPLVPMKSAAAAIKALQDKKISAAIVPPPVDGEKEPWWPVLLADKKNEITVFHSVPFEVLKPGRSNARNSLPTGLVIGPVYPELTGDDRSMLALHCEHVPEAEMKRLFSKAGYKVRVFASKSLGRSSASPTAYYAEVEGYVGRNDTRLGRIKAMMGSRLKHLSPLGGYPVPLKSGRKA
jgi:chorismate mutase